MKKSIQIQIPEPCHENWDQMTNAGEGRYCNACSKVVVDFSAMSDKEILNYISKANSKICGRVSDDQLGRNIMMPAERRQLSLKYFWSFLITSFLISYKSNGQVKHPVKKAVASRQLRPVLLGDTVLIAGGITTHVIENRIDEKSILIQGKVIDEDGVGVPFATILVNDFQIGVATDSNGVFEIKVPRTKADVELTISSIGYETSSMKITLSENKNVIIEMISLKQLLKGVTVTTPSTTICTIRMGGIATIQKVTGIEKFKSRLDNFINKTDIKIYPNPVTAGSVFNINFNVKEAGDYKMEIFDAGGKLVRQSFIHLHSKQQVMNFGSDFAMTRGLYIIRISSDKGRQVYNGKLNLL